MNLGTVVQNATTLTTTTVQTLLLYCLNLQRIKNCQAVYNKGHRPSGAGFLTIQAFPVAAASSLTVSAVGRSSQEKKSFYDWEKQELALLSIKLLNPSEGLESYFLRNFRFSS